MNKTIILITFIVVLIGGIYFYNNQNSGTQVQKPVEITEQAVNIENRNFYKDFSEDELLKATANGGKAVLFFRAGWCPTCSATENDFVVNGWSLDEDITVLAVDYDTATDLKKKYNITYQHTFVQVDSKGNELIKWQGGGIKELNSKTI